MVEKYTDFEIQCDVPDGKQYVLATDYAALEVRLASLDQKFMILQGSHDLLVKERDEWKRRCEIVSKYASNADMLKECNRLESDDDAERIDDYIGLSCWTSERLDYLKAIAEGRDNG